jgi:hypothetical protein
LGGRMVLLKFVMSSLPIYSLSFFKAPSGIVSFIESILNCFLLGGGECLPHENIMDGLELCLQE